MTEDVTRRRFFRRFGDEALATAVTFAGVAGELQRASAEVAGLIDPDEDTDEAPPAADAEVAATPMNRLGTTPFREEAGRLLITDLRPNAAAGAVRSCGTAVEVARAIREGLVRGAPAAADVAALTLAMTAEQVRDVRPWMRRTALRDAAASLTAARVSSAELRSSVARVLRAWEHLGELHPDGAEVAVAVRAEATTVIEGAMDARARMARMAAVAVAGGVETRRLRIMLHGETGSQAAPPDGTAVGVIQALAQAGHSVEMWLALTASGVVGSTSVKADLAARGILARVVGIDAMGRLFRSGEVDAVLLATECVAANGDIAADAGAYPIALLADRHLVPLHVCGTDATLDAAITDGAGIHMAAATSGEWPVVDIVDDALVTTLTTETGTRRGGSPIVDPGAESR